MIGTAHTVRGIPQRPKATHPASTSSHILANVLAIMSIVVLTLLAVGMAGWVAHKYLAARQRRADRLARWAGAKTQLAAVLGRYGEYETDILKAWEYPVIGDVSQPETARFVDALARAQQADRLRIPRQDIEVQRLVEAAAELERHWESLEETALHTGTRRIPAEFTAGVNRAIALLRHGLDANSPEQERRQFVQRAIAEARSAIDHGHLRIPRRAMAALETATVPALAATPGELSPPS